MLDLRNQFHRIYTSLTIIHSLSYESWSDFDIPQFLAYNASISMQDLL